MKLRKKKSITKDLKTQAKNVIETSWKLELLKNNIDYLLMKNGKVVDLKELIIGSSGLIVQLIKILLELKRAQVF